jgi:hypothetical protein
MTTPCSCAPLVPLPCTPLETAVSYCFMSVITGCQLTQNQRMALSMPQDVIDQVNTLGCHSNGAANLSFTWHDGMLILDDDLADDINDNYSNHQPLHMADDDADYDYALSNGAPFDTDNTTTGVDNAPNNAGSNNDEPNDDEDGYETANREDNENEALANNVDSENEAPNKAPIISNEDNEEEDGTQLGMQECGKRTMRRRMSLPKMLKTQE